MNKTTLIDEYKVILGMIAETRSKAKLILQRIDKGEDVSDEVSKIEVETAEYLTRLVSLQTQADLSCA